MAEDHPTTTFLMVGAREVLATDAVYFEQQVIAIEEAVSENAGLAFDLAKTLIESTCKTIQKDRGHTCDDGWELPRLLKETLSILPLVPDRVDGVAASLRKTVGGFQTVIQGIAELRNTHGFASHGKDAYAKQLDRAQAELAARAADVIVNFLFRSHRLHPMNGSTRRLFYRELEDFNNWIDEQNELVRIFAMGYKPSEVLYNVDVEAYRDFLVQYEGGSEAAAAKDEGEEPK
ncbi:MAG: abortive infection family protein [Symbiobacteriia bacterium]